MRNGTDHKARPCGILAKTRRILPKLNLISHSFPPRMTDRSPYLDNWRAHGPDPARNSMAWRPTGRLASTRHSNVPANSPVFGLRSSTPSRRAGPPGCETCSDRRTRRRRCRKVAFGAGIGHTVPLQRRLRRQSANRVTGKTVIRARGGGPRSGGSGMPRANRREAVCAAC